MRLQGWLGLRANNFYLTINEHEVMSVESMAPCSAINTFLMLSSAAIHYRKLFHIVAETVAEINSTSLLKLYVCMCRSVQETDRKRCGI
jgi:hypothetical protein